MSAPAEKLTAARKRRSLNLFGAERAAASAATAAATASATVAGERRASLKASASSSSSSVPPAAEHRRRRSSTSTRAEQADGSARDGESIPERSDAPRPLRKRRSSPSRSSIVPEPPALPAPVPPPPAARPFRLTDEQRAFVESPYLRIPGSTIRVQAGAGAGKCWREGTKLMMFDGSFRKVEDIKDGDRLMGDDSTPRTVLPGTVRSFTGKPFKVTSVNRGRKSWYCNAEHVLVLKWNIRPYPEKVRQGYYVIKKTSVEKTDRLRVVTRVVQMDHVTCKFPTKEEGEAFVEEHCQQDRKNGTVFECTVAEFLSLSAKIQSQCRMFQPVAVHFAKASELKEKIVELWGEHVGDDLVLQTSWVLGVWLSDGHAGSPNISHIGDGINNPSGSHQPVVDHLVQWYRDMHRVDASTASLIVRQRAPTSAGNTAFVIALGWRFRLLLQHFHLLNSKHFPLQLLTEPMSIRRAIFTGLIDGDGCHGLDADKRSTRCWELSAKHKHFMGGFVYLCRSIGFSTGAVGVTRCRNKETGEIYTGYRVAVSGDEVSSIAPVLTYKRIPGRAELPRWPNEDQRCDGFTVEPVDELSTFRGFQLSGNGRCLLEDFVVTHNSTTIKYVAEHLKDKRILYLVLNNSMSEKAKEAMSALENIEEFTFSAMAYQELITNQGYSLEADDDGWKRAVNGAIYRLQGCGFSRKEMYHLCKGMQLYMQSDALEITSFHFSHLWPSARSQRTLEARVYLPSAEFCLVWAKRVIGWMKKKETPLSFGMMLKLFHLADTKLEEKYDLCILDEAQDVFEVVDDCVNPKARMMSGGRLSTAGRRWVLVYVGDRWQAINRHLGGVNALERRTWTASYYFPHSKRFGTRIATLRNEMFRTVGIVEDPVVGNPERTSTYHSFCFYNQAGNRRATPRERAAAEDDDEAGESTDAPRSSSDGPGRRRRWMWEEQTCRWPTVDAMYQDAFGARAPEALRKVVAVLASTNVALLRLLATTFRKPILESRLRFVLAKSLQAYIKDALTYIGMDDDEMAVEEKHAIEERQTDVLGKIDYARRVGPGHAAFLELLVAQQTASIYDQDEDAEQPIVVFQTIHSSKGSDYYAVIAARDLSDSLLEAMAIPDTELATAATDAQVDAVMQRHAAGAARHQYDLDVVFLAGVCFTREEELLAVTPSIYKLFCYFERRAASRRAAVAAPAAACSSSHRS